MATYDINKFTFAGNTYNLASGGIINAYPRTGETPLSSTWLSKTSGGAALTPEDTYLYVLMADSGDYKADSMFKWGGTEYVPLTGKEVHVELTQAQYDALTPAEKNNGIVYFITDGVQAQEWLGAIRITTPSFSSFPQTYSNDKITSRHLLINTVLSNPSAQTTDWNVITNNGYITIDGVTTGTGIDGSTTATFDFVQECD